MKIKRPTDYPQRNGIIAGFTTAPSEYIESIRKDLKLTSPMWVISKLQNHYRYAEKRDPFVGELIMFDILYENASERAIAHRKRLISSLSTSSVEIKESYSDMMEKLAALYPEREGPIELTALAGVASEYLRRIFSGSDRVIKALDERAPELSALIEGASAAEEMKAGEMGFCIAKQGETQEIKNGVFLLMTASYSILPLMRELRGNPGFKFKATMIKHNIIESVVEFCEGAELFVPLDLPFSAVDRRGDLLLLCDEASCDVIMMLASSKGVTTEKVGRVLKDKNIRFVFENRSPLTLKTYIIRQMTEISIFEDKDIIIEENASAGECFFLPVTGECRGKSVTALCCDPTLSPYESGKAIVVTAASVGAERGESPGGISLGCRIRYPASADISALAAFLLGAYRAQIELAVSADISFEISDSIEKPLAVMIECDGRAQIRGGDCGYIYTLSPGKDGDEFENIRRTLKYVRAFIASGKAMRVCALDSEGSLSKNYEGAKPSAGSFFLLSSVPIESAEGVTSELIGEATASNAWENL